MFETTPPEKVEQEKASVTAVLNFYFQNIKKIFVHYCVGGAGSSSISMTMQEFWSFLEVCSFPFPFFFLFFCYSAHSLVFFISNGWNFIQDCNLTSGMLSKPIIQRIFAEANDEGFGIGVKLKRIFFDHSQQNKGL